MDREIQQYKVALKKAINKINDLNSRINQYEKDEIAIIGYSCRFPGGANSPEEYWNLLKQGYDSVDEIPKERFDVDKYYSPDGSIPGTMYTKNAALLNTDIKSFDNVHFEISSLEATSMDPQHKLLLEVSWEAMENAGLNIQKLKGSKTGVFIGISSFEYIRAELTANDVKEITPYSLFGMSLNSAAGRLSYFYDFRGPSVAIDTACSSSMVALNTAVDSLRSGQCDLALVGGVNLILCPQAFIGLSQLKALAPDGRCKVFDNSADGFGRGEGCGIILLKRMEDVKRDKNFVEAIVKSSIIGQDGRANGYYAPNGLAEKEVLTSALKDAGLSPDDLDYLEAHGTGTTLGDLIEMQAINDVYAKRQEPIKIGSVKSNIGHLEAAAGIASIIKVLLSMKHGMLPPSINCYEVNNNVKADGLKVVTQLTKWESLRGKRRAGISCFGITGTLAHAILEEGDKVEKANDLPVMPSNIITISAKNQATLRMTMEKFRDELIKKNTSLSDIAYTSNIRRSHSPYRFAVVGSKRENIIKAFDTALEKKEYFDFNTGFVSGKKEQIAFVFTGQGSIYKDIAKQLYDHSKVYGQAFDECDKLFADRLGISIKDAIYEYSEDRLLQPIYSQPVIFSIEYALSKLWNMIGIYPDMVLGHSIGEYAAACCSGLVSLNNAVDMIVARARLMEKIDLEGKMVGVLADEKVLQELLKQHNCQDVSIAAINAPNNKTISGKKEAVESFLRLLQEKERVFINDLHINRPYHSTVLRTYEQKYEKDFPDFDFQRLQTKMISSVTGKFEQEDLLATKKYWAEQLSKTIQFQASVETAWKAGARVFIEIGGTATLCGLINQCISSNEGVLVPTLRKGREPYDQLLDSLKNLYLHGVEIDWRKFNSEYKNEIVELPATQFRKRIMWKELEY